MAEGDWAFAVETPGVRAARGKMVGYAFDRCEVGGLSVETNLSCYSAHFPYRFSVGDEWVARQRRSGGRPFDMKVVLCIRLNG
ncbi:hypothetical protein D3C76_908650 [compost metagenome]